MENNQFNNNNPYGLPYDMAGTNNGMQNQFGQPINQETQTPFNTNNDMYGQQNSPYGQTTYQSIPNGDVNQYQTNPNMYGQQPMYNVPNYNQEQKKKSKAPLIIIIVLAVLTILCCLGCCIFGEKEFSFTDYTQDDYDNDEDINISNPIVGNNNSTSNDKIDKDNEVVDTSSSKLVYDYKHDFDNISFTVNGDKIQFPITVQDLIDLGYEFEDEDIMETLEPDYYSSTFYGTRNEGEEIRISAMNFSNKDTLIKDCTVKEFIVEYDSFSEKTNTWKMDNGCVLGKTTIKEFDENIFNPTYTYDNENYDAHSRDFEKESEFYYEDLCYSYYFLNGILREVTIIYLK